MSPKKSTNGENVKKKKTSLPSSSASSKKDKDVSLTAKRSNKEPAAHSTSSDVKNEGNVKRKEKIEEPELQPNKDNHMPPKNKNVSDKVAKANKFGSDLPEDIKKDSNQDMIDEDTVIETDEEEDLKKGFEKNSIRSHNRDSGYNKADDPELAEKRRPLAKGDTPDFKWYVAHVLTGQEDRVRQSLFKRIYDYRLEEYFADIYVVKSTEEVGGGEARSSSGKSKKRSIVRNFFPGYILIKMIMNDKTWHLVKNTDKVTGFVGANKTKPSPISDDEAAYLTNQAIEGFRNSRPGSNFSEGDSVRVIEGPFASFIGTVETVTDKGRVRVQVSIFGRPTPVELDFSQIEKV